MWTVSESTRTSCSISRTLPVAEPFANVTRTIRSPKGYRDRYYAARSAYLRWFRKHRASTKVTPGQMDLRLRLSTERGPLETPREVDIVHGNIILG